MGLLYLWHRSCHLFHILFGIYLILNNSSLIHDEVETHFEYQEAADIQ